MNVLTLEKLKKAGWDEGVLNYIRDNFAPRKTGKYKMKIFTLDGEHLRPEDGILIDTASFDDAKELSLIHHFYEGNAYILTVAETDKELGRGVLNGAPFTQVEEEGWTRLNEEETLQAMRKPRRSTKKKEA